MKGLITKDIRLLLRQKNMLLTVALCLILLSHNGLEFTLGMFIMLLSMLGESTVNYDTADNGMAYLMTLPMRRSSYVLEKYLFTLVPGVMATVLAIGIRFTAALIQQQPADYVEIFVSCIGIFLITSLVAVVFLPIELKFGMEKARIVITVMGSAFGIGLYMLMQNGNAAQEVLVRAGEIFGGMSQTALFAGAVGIWFVLMAVSVLCSVRVMEKKEF